MIRLEDIVTPSGVRFVALLSVVAAIATAQISRRTQDEQNTIDIFTKVRAGVVHIKARQQASTEFGTERHGFGVPINLAKRVVPDFISMGHPYRPSLGVDGIGITPEIAELFGLPRRRGLLVERVEPWSLAERAGIRAGTRIVFLNESAYVLGGDILTAIEGEEISSAGQVARILLYTGPGETLTATLFRDGGIEDLTVPLGPMHQR